MENKSFKDFFNIENRTKYFLHVLAFLCVTSLAIFGLLLIGQKALLNNEKKVTANIVNPFENIDIEAKGSVVWDVVNQRELFSKNSDLPLPLASLTKVMTVITADANLPDGLNIKINPEYLAPEGDSELIVGDTWKADDLRDFTLLTSSNDGALALASVAESRVANKEGDLQAQFIQAMNDMALQIGLTNSKFFNEHGLDREVDRGGAYGSAHDMAILFEYTLKNYPEVLEATRYKNLQFASAAHLYSADNTNAFVDQIPNLIASKTGFTDLAGGNLIIAYDAGLNRPIIISILGSSAEGRFTDALKLVEASIEYINDN